MEAETSKIEQHHKDVEGEIRSITKRSSIIEYTENQKDEITTQSLHKHAWSVYSKRRKLSPTGHLERAPKASMRCRFHPHWKEPRNWQTQQKDSKTKWSHRIQGRSTSRCNKGARRPLRWHLRVSRANSSDLIGTHQPGQGFKEKVARASQPKWKYTVRNPIAKREYARHEFAWENIGMREAAERVLEQGQAHSTRWNSKLGAGGGSEAAKCESREADL